MATQAATSSASTSSAPAPSRNTAEASIVVDGLTKLYGSVRALDQIHFTVRPGEVVGFLGPNGAGKTTTMKILTCFMSASDGTTRVAGYDVHEQPDEVRQRIGYLPENVPLYEEMLVYDYLRFIAEIRGVSSQTRRTQIKRVSEMTGLGAVISRPIRELSKGYRQRVGLAQAIIHEPDVVILDEPTTGLDPNQIVEIRDVITTIGREKTVIFSTHIMQEVSAVCDRIIIINQGRIVADDTLTSLQADLVKTRPGLVAIFGKPDSTNELRKILATTTGVTRVYEEEAPIDEVAFRLETTRPDDVRKSLHQIAAEGTYDLKYLARQTPDLETVFRHLAGGSTQEGQNHTRGTDSASPAPSSEANTATPTADSPEDETQA